MENEQDKLVNIVCEFASKINFAAHQSDYVVLRALSVDNPSELSFENVTLTLTSDPPFLKPKEWKFDKIAPREKIPIRDLDIELNGEYLLSLTEALRGTAHLNLVWQGETITTHSQRIDLLAYNEWGGTEHMPELLAAFSLPNDPAVDRILRDASLILRRHGRPDAIDGYQANSRTRVWEITAAIYGAVAEMGLSYANPPASFESEGQKIRLPGQIRENGVATCLDTALLFSSALEQAGLNPIIALLKGHALVGVWLEPKMLASVVSDRAEILRKRIEMDELILIETTYVTQRPLPRFKSAVEAGKAAVALGKDNLFVAAVDIHKARSMKIKPLAQKVGAVGSNIQVNSGAERGFVLEKPPPLEAADAKWKAKTNEDTPSGRLDRWQRKLLDLSARNPLLNFRLKSGLKLICPEPSRLETLLEKGKKIEVLKISDEYREAAQNRRLSLQDLLADEARKALESKRVLADIPVDEFERRVTKLYRKARSSLQESGTNTLYLAFGFLFWRRDGSSKPFRAPLVLLPVSLERARAGQHVKLEAYDDEPRFNTTLLEMLRKDFGVDISELEADLRTNGQELDLKAIWQRVREAVFDLQGFEVVEDVALGHFSFAKYLMWKDLVERADELRKSAVVRHLLDSPKEPYPSNIKFVGEDKIDKKYAPADFLTVLPTDASQMSAIATADQGKDFIIIGPPGTGKSQTISNIIAHFLGKGKKVLFVSEKAAALEVVLRRLEDIGLGRFCLPLHSNKARKAEVLSRLRGSWELASARTPAGWEVEAEHLRKLRDRLNQLVDHLHKPGRNGLTPYEAMGVKVRDRELAERVRFRWESADAHNREQLQKIRDVADELGIRLQVIGDVVDTPFRLVDHTDWSPQWEEDVVERAEKLAEAARVTIGARDSFLRAINLEIGMRGTPQNVALAKLARLLTESHSMQISFVLEPHGTKVLEALGQAVNHLRSYKKSQAKLSCAYEAFAWRKLDGGQLQLRWRETAKHWWLKRLLARRAIVAEMRAGGALGKPKPENDAPLLAKLRDEGLAIDQLDDPLSVLGIWARHDTDPDVADKLYQLANRLKGALAQLTSDPQEFIEIRNKLRLLLREKSGLLASDGVIGRSALKYIESFTNFREAAEAFAAVAGNAVLSDFDEESDSFLAIHEAARAVAERHEELRDWCNWRSLRAAALNEGLEPLVAAIESGRVKAGEVRQTFEAAYCDWWSRAVLSEDEVLKRFSADDHENAIKKFQKSDDRFLKLTADHIAATLRSKLPALAIPSRSSGWGIIRRELEKKRRHKPIRRLVQEASDALTTLTPCFMMSPLSVAQYLPPELELFDVVIFDEASQITVWDAIGSLARGRQVIVAGDTKQMPPTNFFNRVDADPEDEIDDEGDLESVLDEMRAARIPEITLNMHYRSRRESLIAFSNYHYYDDRLITFPAPEWPDHGVRLVQVDGRYSRGKARHNVEEARAVVREIVRRVTHEDPHIRERSIGVVTFNAQQQALIENLLEQERVKYPQIEHAFVGDDKYEPIFVKNLETVQGDERDVILFSITYGPDQSGQLSMNFGPLNQAGGERRLNVALTRARHEMLVFSSLRPDQINLSRTQARAVADLKRFLEFAVHGPSVLGKGERGSVGDFESPFEEAVARALKDRGWDVLPQIGVSRYRIDLGIVHPDRPGIFLAGVECDGASYHSSKYARERDKIRQQVLEGLGWTLYRVWSTDWWTNPSAAIEKLDRKLQSHLAQERSRLGTQSHINQSTAEGAPQTTSSGVAVSDPAPSQREEPQTFAHQVDLGEELLQNEQKDFEYIEAQLDGKEYAPAPELFYERSYTSKLMSMTEHVIDVEGPIHEEVLVRRIARYHGFKRAGRRIRERVLRLAKLSRPYTSESVGIFFWQKHGLNERQVPARYKNRSQEMRDVRYICKEEIRAIEAALNLQGDVVQLARMIGIERLREPARRRLEEALKRKSE